MDHQFRSMGLRCILLVIGSATLLHASAGLLTAQGPAAPATPTFNADVLPILQKRCQDCHRPGEIGPMPLLTYAEARPWASAIRRQVTMRQMPPWFSSDPHGRYANDSRLSDVEIDTVTRWVAGGAPEGRAAEAPKPRAFEHGWQMGTPDRVISLPKPFEVSATGTIDTSYILVPTRFTEDVWVESIEIRPTDRAAVHHVQLYVRPPDSSAMRNQPIGEYWSSSASGASEREDGEGEILANGETEQVCVFVPGNGPCALAPGYARLIPRGSDLYFILHYQSTGKGVSDQTRVGFRIAKTPPRKRVRNFFVAHRGLRIPPHVASIEFPAAVTVARPVELLSLMPHMHLRGKAFRFELAYPDGRTETPLRVPRYDPNWQLTYVFATPLMLPPGTTIRAFGTFDNSRNNPLNPDATKEIRWGQQNWDEMHTGFFDVAVPVGDTVTGLFVRRTP